MRGKVLADCPHPAAQHSLQIEESKAPLPYWLTPVEDVASLPITVMMNWTALLKK